MKSKNYILALLLTSLCFFTNAQHIIDVKATFIPEKNSIKIEQTINFINTSTRTLNEIFLSDWNNASSNNKSELAKRFVEEYAGRLQFSKDSYRGVTTINSITVNLEKIIFERIEVDIVKIALKTPLAPKSSVVIKLNYNLQLPHTKFTRFGIDYNKNVKLKNWFITPAKLTSKNWEYYSNKNLDDFYFPNANLTLTLTYPKNYTVVSSLNVIKKTVNKKFKTQKLTGKNIIFNELHLTKEKKFRKIETDKFTFITNINDDKLIDGLKAVIHDKIASFITEKLGDYPHKNMLLSNVSYRKNPVYGISQLPSFIHPFPDGFKYEIKILKSTISNFIKNTVNTNPRTDFWLNDALETYLMMQYVKDNYPNMKILGSLSEIWGIRSFQIAKKHFNEQYQYFSQYTARKNLDQPIKTPKDSLLRYNANIANKNKAGIGLLYLDDYLGKNLVSETITEFYKKNNLKSIHSEEFITLLQAKTNKDISWFIPDFINTHKRIDYTIKEVHKNGNFIDITLKNIQKSSTPISIYQLINDTIVSKQYVEGFLGTKTFKIPNNKPDRIILNYEGIIPEYNLRNNTKTLKPHLFNKPLKFSLLKDAEASNHNQLFYVPELGFNLYDGVSLGVRLTNKTLLKKNFTYSLKPLYGTRSEKITGSMSTQYSQHFKNKKLFTLNYGISYQNYHYKEELRYQKINPYLHFSFRKKNNLRSDFYQYATARYVSVNKEIDLNPETALDNATVAIPNYNVLNFKYGIGDSDLFNNYRFNADVQFAKNFSKLSLTYSFQKSFKDNKLISFRVFAGTFLQNNTNTNFFGFSLDRPSDYLFDYNYYGRSEDTGIYRQQIIIAEGGFKSRLNIPLTNKWMTTASVSTNLWRYIFVYGDVGLVGSEGNPQAVYDTGLHLNLVPGYFELYFPVSSTLGWEIAQPNYQEKIRFKIILSPKVLIGLVTRKWL